MDKLTIPNQFELMWPTLEALKALGGSGRIEEIVETVAKQQQYSEDQMSVQHGPSNRMSRIEYNLAWARTNLKKVDAIENSKRGVWAITDRGRRMTEAEVTAEIRAWRAEYSREYQAKKQIELADSEGDSGDPQTDEPEWTERLLDCLNDLSPDGFERLAQRILREAGFRNVDGSRQIRRWRNRRRWGTSGSRLSRSRCTSSVRSIVIRSGPTQCGTFAARWPGVVKRVC